MTVEDETISLERMVREGTMNLTKKVVINICIGGFGLSKEATREVAKRKGIPLEWEGDWAYVAETMDSFTPGDIYTGYGSTVRGDPDLIAVIEEMGELADGDHAELKIVEIPVDVDYWVNEAETGVEDIHEVHRIWKWLGTVAK